MGAIYRGPHAVIFWPLYTARLASDSATLSAAAKFWDAIPVAKQQNPLPAPKVPSSAWATAGQSRVMVWNGGASDL